RPSSPIVTARAACLTRFANRPAAGIDVLHVSIDLPPVVGDPAGMRALAAALRSTASKASTVDQAVWGHVSALHFTGPAANRIAGEVRAWHGEVSGAVAELNETAGLLERAAAEVEREQVARLRMIHQ